MSTSGNLDFHLLHMTCIGPSQSEGMDLEFTRQCRLFFDAWSLKIVFRCSWSDSLATRSSIYSNSDERSALDIVKEFELELHGSPGRIYGKFRVDGGFDRDRGFTRLLGLGHIFWLPTLYYPWPRLGQFSVDGVFGVWLRVMIGMNVAALAIWLLF